MLYTIATKNLTKHNSLEKDELEQKTQEDVDAPIESPTVILVSIMFPFFVAGFGMVGAGLFFDHVVVSYLLLYAF